MKKITFIIGLIGVIFTSCQPYEDFTGDFDNSTVYFASQKPLRTIVAYNQMQFKVGVALGGKRENTQDEYADFVIDPTLLNTVSGASGFTLLPASYYTLSDAGKMIIPKDKFIGDVTVTLNRELFTTNPLSLSNTYALPLRITNSSLDSIGGFGPLKKDYTILVVKYISPFSGTFYINGTTNTRYLKTVDRNSVSMTGVGGLSGQSFVINVDESNNSVTIDSPSSGITNLIGSGAYNATTGTFTLTYSFTSGGTDYNVSDTLVVRRPPEQDLGFEEW